MSAKMSAFIQWQQSSHKTETHNLCHMMNICLAIKSGLMGV